MTTSNGLTSDGAAAYLVILLHTPDVNVLLRRIAERGREEERITNEFLRGLNGYYETFDQVSTQKYGHRVLKETMHPSRFPAR
ncbi:MAG: hypothetical protein R3E66_11910 [bacterium]